MILLNVPLALTVLFGVIRFAPVVNAAGRVRLRLGSALLITLALGALVVGLDRAAAHGWLHSTTGLLLGAGVLLTVGFAVSLAKSRDPLIPVFLLTDRARLSALCAVFLIGIGSFAGMFMLTSLLQDALDYSPIETGAAFLPWGVAAVVAAQFLGPIRKRVPPDLILAGGMLLVAAALGLLALLRTETAYLTGVMPVMLLFGAGSTAVMVTSASAVTANAGANSGIAGALVNSSQQIGAALGTALLAAFTTVAARPETATVHPEQAMITGSSIASGVGAAAVALGAIVVVALARIRAQQTTLLTVTTPA